MNGSWPLSCGEVSAPGAGAIRRDFKVVLTGMPTPGRQGQYPDTRGAAYQAAVGPGLVPRPCISVLATGGAMVTARREIGTATG